MQGGDCLIDYYKLSLFLHEVMYEFQIDITGYEHRSEDLKVLTTLEVFLIVSSMFTLK